MTYPASSLINPILVHTRRGSLVENRHRGAYVVVDQDGDIVVAAGHFKEMIYARSALKPINVLAMLVSGAADHFQVTDEEIALACASHSGEEQHVRAVAAWLDRIGCTDTDLECGIHAPMGATARRQLREKGLPLTALYNACSGKHTGFLTLTQFLKAPLQGYTQIHHPTQKEIMKIAAQMVGIKVDETPKGIDGCNIPMMAMPMMNLAQGMVKLVAPQNLEPSLHQACERVISAMQTYPFLVAGTHRFCTEVIEKTKGKVLVKMGADGVFSGVAVKKKWGIALKIDDGDLQAAETAMIHLLNRLKLLETDVSVGDENPFKKWLNLPIYSWTKEPVGYYESAF